MYCSELGRGERKMEVNFGTKQSRKPGAKMFTTLVQDHRKKTVNTRLSFKPLVQSKVNLQERLFLIRQGETTNRSAIPEVLKLNDSVNGIRKVTETKCISTESLSKSQAREKIVVGLTDNKNTTNTLSNNTGLSNLKVSVHERLAMRSHRLKLRANHIHLENHLSIPLNKLPNIKLDDNKPSLEANMQLDNHSATLLKELPNDKLVDKKPILKAKIQLNNHSPKPIKELPNVNLPSLQANKKLENHPSNPLKDFPNNQLNVEKPSLQANTQLRNHTPKPLKEMPNGKLDVKKPSSKTTVQNVIKDDKVHSSIEHLNLKRIESHSLRIKKLEDFAKRKLPVVSDCVKLGVKVDLTSTKNVWPVTSIIKTKPSIKDRIRKILTQQETINKANVTHHEIKLPSELTSIESDLEFIVDKMKRLSFKEESNASDLNQKRILSFNSRLESLKKLVDEDNANTVLISLGPSVDKRTDARTILNAKRSDQKKRLLATSALQDTVSNFNHKESNFSCKEQPLRNTQAKQPNVSKRFEGLAVDLRTILNAKRSSQQTRFFVTNTSQDTVSNSNSKEQTLKNNEDSKIDSKENNKEKIRGKKNNLKSNIVSLSNNKGTSHLEAKNDPLECKHIKVESISELKTLYEKFPFPKNTLHNYYSLLADQIKDKSLKVEPHYSAMKTKHGAKWNCSYHLKWPENCKISYEGMTKKQASSYSALRCILYLQECGKISTDGSPLVYTKDEVRKLTQKKEIELEFNDRVINKMQNIVDIFNKNLSPFIENMAYGNYKDQENKIIGEEADSYLSGVPKYLGMHHYLAKEKVELPISKYKDSFIDLIQNNNCVIVKGEPGCGKSSRVPQYVLESWVREASSEDSLCRIAVTQPRRIAAISLAERVASERAEELGRVVGYQVRLKSNFQPKTGRILYCTTGILLRHLQTDSTLTNFSHVILDEAHERDVNTDLLMNLLKRAMEENTNLKVVVMSATIDAEKFSEYFGGAPVCNVPGFTYPVTRHFIDTCKLDLSRTMKMCQGDNSRVIHEDVVEVLGYIHKNKPEGAILTFLPGWEDLAKIQKLIPQKNDVVVHLVHSKLKDSEQHMIFSRPPPGVRKIILATNIAETSITIDDVVYVVDTGIHKDQIFDNDKGINVIDMEWISKANADQRKGRAGRCSPGECFHLYPENKYQTFAEYSSPKILNSSLTKIVLDCKMYSNNMNASQFMNSLISPPEKVAVERAVDELKQLELLDEDEKLTPLGRTLSNFQLEPNLAKAMVNGVVFKCSTPIVDIVTLFSSETGLFGSLNLTDKDTVKNVKSQFCKTSDHLALMRLYEKWLELCEEDDHGTANRFCRQTNLMPYKLELVQKLKEIHFGYLYNGLYDSLPISDDFSDSDEIVKAVLFSGTGTVLQHRNWDIVKNRLKTKANVLVTRNNHKATITAESVNYKRNKFPSDFLVYINETRSNVRRTTIVRECSLIPPISVLLFSNKGLEILKVPADENASENLVKVGIKNTKLQFLCDKTQANTLLTCKEAIDSSYKFLIYQLTHAGEEIPEFLRHWDGILRHISEILEEFKVD